jgi:hypothetical protein
MIGRHLHLADAIELLAQACRGDSDGQIEDFWSGFSGHGTILKKKIRSLILVFKYHTHTKIDVFLQLQQ